MFYKGRFLSRLFLYNFREAVWRSNCGKALWLDLAVMSPVAPLHSSRAPQGISVVFLAFRVVPQIREKKRIRKWSVSKFIN